MTTRTFTYIGGKEADGITDLPGIVTVFGVEFRMDRPVTLDSDTFDGGRAKFDHAVSKLGTHPHFQDGNGSRRAPAPLGGGSPAPVDVDQV